MRGIDLKDTKGTLALRIPPPSLVVVKADSLRRNFSKRCEKYKLGSDPMKTQQIRNWTLLTLVGAGLYAGGWFSSQFIGRVWPFSNTHVLSAEKVQAGSNDGPTHDDHAGHDHAVHSSATSLELSELAMKNLGLSEEYLQPIELRNYQQIVTVPAIVVDKPGRTRLPISASMTGIVTHIHAVAGVAIEPGDLILEMRLTHEDLVTAQKEYLQTLGDREIELKEIARIEGIVNSGAISSKLLLERQYNRDKLESLLRSQREGLRLHALTESQISIIDSEKRLLTEIRVYAPNPDVDKGDEIRLMRQSEPSIPRSNRAAELSGSLQQPESSFRVAALSHVSHAESAAPQSASSTDKKRLLVVQDMLVQKGQSVSAGETLCVLADFEELMIEGQAFEAEASQVATAKVEGRTVSALLNDKSPRIENLTLSWLDNEIDPTTRTLKFYVTLKNQLLADNENEVGLRHISWKYRVGQRMELGIPIAEWIDQIVLPIDAVVREGVESFVFQQNGEHFDRVAVHEKYRDRTSVVVENDGALFPGDVVAMRGAHQMQMAIKTKSGGGIDPHAGHNH